MTDVDVIVIGAGHNALITAAYLATAGLTVTVLEAYERPGGDTITEELTLPGYRHDSCSTAHTLIQANPLIRQNELRLDRFGLRYILPDPVYTVPLPGGESLTMYRDPERTVGEIARFSERDAQAYRELLTDWEALRPLQAEERNGPPLTPGEADALWTSGPLGDEGVRIRLSSGLGMIQERFESPEVRAFIAWVASMTLEPIDQPFTGVLPFSLTAGRQENSWAIPEGGSGALVEALLRIIRHAGGEVICNARVLEVLLDGSRAAGVRTTDGRELRAAKAVVSSAHITQLPGMLPAAVDEASSRSIEGWHAGLTMFVSHYALGEAPRYRVHGGETTAVAAGNIESVENLHRILADFRSGRPRTERPFLLCLNPTAADPSRAPDGMHTLKIVGMQPYSLEGGPERWDAIKEEVSQALLETYLSMTVNLTGRHILGRLAESPLDLERRNANNWRGSCHGGAQSPSQSGWFRPAPALNGYRTPVEGFYLTGSCTHPGGSVSGFPGRNAARAVLADLGYEWEQVLQQAAGAR
jgi:phytoene dehydrogenase-like protein